MDSDSYAEFHDEAFTLANHIINNNYSSYLDYNVSDINSEPFYSILLTILEEHYNNINIAEEKIEEVIIYINSSKKGGKRKHTKKNKYNNKNRKMKKSKKMKKNKSVRQKRILKNRKYNKKTKTKRK